MQVKPGYKQTEVGVVPKDWSLVPLSTIATTVASGRTRSYSEFGDYFVFGSTGILGKTSKADYSGRAILVARVGANAGKLSLATGEYGVSDNTIIINIDQKHKLKYVWRQLQARRLNTLIFGSGQPLITGTQLKNLKLPFPPTIGEEEAIAEALGDTDALIESGVAPLNVENERQALLALSR